MSIIVQTQQDEWEKELLKRANTPIEECIPESEVNWDAETTALERKTEDPTR